MALFPLFPGVHARTLAEHRLEAQSEISGERLYVERMAQRPRPETDTLDVKLRDEVLKKIDQIYADAAKANDTDELDDLTDEAELEGLFAAYLRPLLEITIEGDLIFDQIEGWGIPKSSTDTARRIWDEATKNGKDRQPEARGALYAIFAERDAWEDYLDDYDETTDKTMRRLFFAILVLFAVSVFSLHYAVLFPPLLILGISAAGAAGSCGSVMSTTPTLDVSKLYAYMRGVFSRIGTGLIATVIGCASLAWIPLSIQSQTFGDMISACTTTPSNSPAATCTSFKMLVLLGVPMLIGYFSEGALPFFGQRIFGKAGLSPATPRSKKRKI